MIKQQIQRVPAWRLLVYVGIFFLLALSLPGLLLGVDAPSAFRLLVTALLLLVAHLFLQAVVEARWPALVFPAICGSLGLCAAVLLQPLFG
jgi:hypothetical protein